MMDVSGGMVLRRYFRETWPRRALRLMSSEEWDSCREMRWAAISEVARRKRSCSGAERSEEFFRVLVGLRPEEEEVVEATMVGGGPVQLFYSRGGRGRLTGRLMLAMQ